LQKFHGQIQGVVNETEKKLETAQKLMKLKLITRDTSLTALIVYYKLYNGLLRIALKIV